MLSKTLAASLPFAVLLVLWWKQQRVRGKDFLALAPYFLIAAELGRLTASLEVNGSGAHGPEWQLSFLERCLIAGHAVWFYAAKLVWPHPLMIIYPRWAISPAVWWQYLFPVAAVGVIFILWFCRKRLGKAPMVAVLFFTGLLAPTPAFINIAFMHYSYVADHWQYLASVGLLALGAGCVAGLVRRQAVRTALGVITTAILGTLTWQHSHAFRDQENLFNDNLTYNPRSWVAHYNLGNLRYEAGRDQEAIAHYELAVQIKPDYTDAHNNLANALLKTGKIPDAIKHYNEALRFEPSLAVAHYNLGIALARMGKLQEAIAQYELAVQINPRYAEARNALADTLPQIGRVEDAIRQGEQAVQLQPESAEAHNNLGNALFHAGDVQRAIGHYEQAVRIKPAYVDAHYNLGNSLLHESRLAEAIQHYEQTLRLNPEIAEAHNNLGFALLQIDRLQDAVSHFQQALQIRPDFAEAHYNLGNAMLREGKTQDARRQYQQALQIKPEFPDAQTGLAHALAIQEKTDRAR